MKKLTLYNKSGIIKEYEHEIIFVDMSNLQIYLRDIYINGSKQGEFNVNETGYLITEYDPEVESK